MITNQGNNVIGRALADFMGTHIVVGVGEDAATEEDSSLKFETYRAEVRVRSYDPTTGRIVYAATLPDHLTMNISEVGLVTSSASEFAGDLISTFDPSFEEWIGGTETSTNMRVGGVGRNVALGTASTTFYGRTALSNATIGDTIQVAYFGNGGNVEVRLGNSSTEYFSFNFPASAGYNVYSTLISSMTKTGSPDISSITEMSIIHSGTGSVTLDAIRVNSVNDEESMIVRQVFSTMYPKIAGVPLDIEVPVVISL